MIKQKIIKLKKLINLYNLDGYLIPKNDAYFSEFSSPDRLKTISKFFLVRQGMQLFLKKRIYYLLMVDIQFKHNYNLENILKLLKFQKIYLKIFSKNIKKNYRLVLIHSYLQV